MIFSLGFARHPVGIPPAKLLDAQQLLELLDAAGARFVVMICGDVMTMPGLPKVPAAHAIDVDEDGRITGLF